MNNHPKTAPYRLRQMAKETVLILAGILLASLALEAFLLPNGFLDGGITGVSLLVRLLTGWPLAVLLFGLNLPFVIMAYFQETRRFAIKTLFAIIGLSIAVSVIHFPHVTHDKLLVSVFGGFFLGAGVGLCMRGGCVLDGTEVLAVYLSRKSSLTVGDLILGLNVLIFAAAALLINLDTALYSLLTYMSAAKTIDFVVHGIEEYTAVMIVSDRSDEIRQAIIHNLGRGVTILKGQSGFVPENGQPRDLQVLYTVVTRLELYRLKLEVSNIDERAFIVENGVNDVRGGVIKKKPLH